MSEASTSVIIVIFAAVLPCAVLGYFISFKEKHHLIAGWDPSKVRDAKAYGNVIGGGLMALAALIAAATYVWLRAIISEAEYTMAVSAGAILPLGSWIYAKIKYQ